MTSELKSSYIILTRIKNELINTKNGLDYIKEQKIAANNSGTSYDAISKINTTMWSLIYFSFIRWVAFQDEYVQFFKSNDTTEEMKVNLVKTKAEKYFDIINDTFGDVKLARNKVLAHGYRDWSRPLSNKQINTFFNRLVGHDGLEPYLKMSACAESIVQLICEEFGELPENEISLSEND